MDDAIASAGNGGDGGFFSFFSEALSGISAGIGTTAREVVPRFFASELLDQQQNRLIQPTYLLQPGAARNSQYGTSLYPQQYDAYGRPIGGVQNAGLLFDNVNVNATGIIVIAVAVVAGIILLKS